MKHLTTSYVFADLIVTRRGVVISEHPSQMTIVSNTSENGDLEYSRYFDYAFAPL